MLTLPLGRTGFEGKICKQKQIYSGLREKKHLCGKERRRDGTGKGDNQKQIRTQALTAQK
jgi:hypothetical protein